MLVDLAMVDPKALVATELSLQQTSDEQLRKFERYVVEIFTALGLDLGTRATKEASQRFIHALFSVTSGFESGRHALKLLSTECQRGPACREAHVVEGPIRFLGFCERHSFLLFGHAYVGYVAHEQIMGICKLRQLVQLLTLQFIGQEMIRQQIADAIETLLQQLGVAVYLETDHHCAHMQGSPRPASHWIVWRGHYSLNPALQTEFMSACGLEG
jgi:GTP cyclohydrolase I